ncbi:MAG: cytochrome c oxidase subunit II [Pirellulaceae bacterium]|nr:cytochrome c oxidase subunit II [Pirellulaceae bacterium]
MGRIWSLMFLSVPILGTGMYLIGMLASSGPLALWFPENINPLAVEIDRLHDIILALIGVVFIVTSVALFWFMWKYDATSNPEKAKFVHGNHKLEVWWTVIPAVILIMLAIYQFKVYADVRINRPMLAGADGTLGTADDQPEPPSFEVIGRQFEWRIRYAGADKQLDTADDIIGEVNELHAPKDVRLVGSLKAADVLHSFFIPALRLKNDMIPGTRQIVWFQASKPGTYDIVCTELCGWGHYKMKGRFVVESQEEFATYLERLRKAQFDRSYDNGSPSDQPVSPTEQPAVATVE